MSNDTLNERLLTLSELRDRAEARALLLMELQQGGELDAMEVSRLKLTNEDARAAMNAWIEAMAMAHIQGEPEQALQIVSAKLEEGAAKAEAFMQAVESHLPTQRSFGVGSIVESIISTFVNAGVEI